MIAEAAILLPGGRVVTVPRPGRHHTIIHKLAAEGHPKPVRGEQGFVTDTGEFLDRKQAVEHALKCGQIKEPKRQLYSEDLW